MTAKLFHVKVLDTRDAISFCMTSEGKTPLKCKDHGESDLDRLATVVMMSIKPLNEEVSLASYYKHALQFLTSFSVYYFTSVIVSCFTIIQLLSYIQLLL